MQKILINIIPFKGKPIDDSVLLWEYVAKDEYNWSDIGWLIRQIRRTIRDSDHLVFQFGRKMLSTKKLEEEDDELLIRFSRHFKSVADYNAIKEDDEGLEILRRLIGEAISHKLRNQKRHAFKVIEEPNTVYFASNPTQVQGFGEIEVYRGFTFVPLINPDGTAGVIIDPRNKYHTIHTLRQIELDRIQELQLDHIDTCPIKSCEEKRDPLSTCRLSGPGSSIKIINFRDDPPSRAKRDEDYYYDLIEYHAKKSICPKEYLAKFIKNKPPIAVSDFGYLYPLERIRQSPRPHLIQNYEDRRELHKLVALDPARRFNKTRSYAKLIQSLYITDDLQLETDTQLLSNFEETSINIQSGQFPTMQLLLGSNNKSYYANRDLSKLGPYKIPENTGETKVVLVFIGKHHKESQFESIFTDILSCTSSKADLTNISFSSLLNVNIRVIRTFRIKSSEELKDLFSDITELARNNRKIIFFLLIGGSKSEGLVLPIKRFLIQSDLPNQGINIANFLEKADQKQSLYFFNILLGAFCKIGGVPWAIEPTDASILYIGYSRLIGDEGVRYSIAAYDSYGIWCGGSVGVSSKDSFTNQFESDFYRMIDGRKENKIRFYATGSLYEKTEFEVIKNTLKKCGKHYSILEIVHNPLRIYNVSKKGWYSANRGSYVQISPNQASIVTTIPPGGQGTPKPLLIRLKVADQALMRQYLQEIFALTHYVGYGRMVIRYPSPIHATRQILSKVRSLNITTSFSFKNPWFI